MIKSIRMKNFFSYQDEIIEFNKDINLLIGINGAGKSNIIKAIKLLKEGIAGKGLKNLILNSWGGFDAMMYSGINIADEQRKDIFLEYNLDPVFLSKYGFPFTDEVIYIVKVFKKPNTENYFLSEYLACRKKAADPYDDYIYIDFFNGKGKISERLEDSKTRLVHYDSDFDSDELVLSTVKDPDRYPFLEAIKKAISSIMIYEKFDVAQNAELRKPNLATSEIRLSEYGDNLPQILNTIKINDRKSHNEILESLKEVNPLFSDIDFNILGGRIELLLGERGLNRSIHVTHISEGTLQYLCLMAVIYNKNRGAFICFEEPDIGLHPDMLREVSKRLKEASEETQFLISTHSVKMLDYFHWTDVLVVEKDDDNSSIVTKYEEEDFGEWYNEYSLGKMWQNGDLGGTRW